MILKGIINNIKVRPARPAGNGFPATEAGFSIEFSEVAHDELTSQHTFQGTIQLEAPPWMVGKPFGKPILVGITKCAVGKSGLYWRGAVLEIDGKGETGKPVVVK